MRYPGLVAQVAAKMGYEAAGISVLLLSSVWGKYIRTLCLGNSWGRHWTDERLYSSVIVEEYVGFVKMRCSEELRANKDDIAALKGSARWEMSRGSRVRGKGNRFQRMRVSTLRDGAHQNSAS